MRFRLTPVDRTFYDLFTRSASALVDGAQILAEMLADDADHADIARRMKEAEHHCDEITHDIIRRINSTFVTPFDREDMYRLAAGLDDVMDEMEAGVDYVHLYQIDRLPDGVAEQIDVLQQTAALTADAMPRLRTLNDLEEYWIEVNRLENVADQIYRRSLADLFNGGTYSTITIIKLKDLIEQFERAMDGFEGVANTIEQIAVKES